jgi:sarcosine oxidase delta subunit
MISLFSGRQQFSRCHYAVKNSSVFGRCAGLKLAGPLHRRAVTRNQVSYQLENDKTEKIYFYHRKCQIGMKFEQWNHLGRYFQHLMTNIDMIPDRDDIKYNTGKRLPIEECEYYEA